MCIRDSKYHNYTGGTGTGRECGPYHHHGFEGIELKVANDITEWIIK